MKRNIEEAAFALTEKPILATSVERVMILDEIKSQFKELPQPLRFSKTLSILLSRVSVPLEPYDLIAGRCVDRELTAEEEVVFQAYRRHPDNPKKEVIFSSGHCTYAWEDVVSLGLGGLRALSINRLSEADDPDQKIFLTAAIEIYDAITAYLLRYANAAEKNGMTQLAQNLRDAASERPTTFASTLQLLWIITLIDCAYITPNPTLTVGRLDQILYPFYREELERGTLTRNKAAAYVTDYYCKHNLIMGRGEHQVGDKTNSTTFDRIFNFDAPQYMMLAGTDENGNSAVNDLTLLFAECIQPSFKNPVVVVRYFKGMDQKHPDLWSVLVKKASQSASMMFYNDDNILATYARIGLPNEDAYQYTHFGYNWPSLGAHSSWMQIGPRSKKYNVYRSDEERRALDIPFMRMNMPGGWPEDFMIVARELAERDPATVSIEDFYVLFFARMEDFIDRKLTHLSHELSVRQRRPSALLTFGDCFLTDSIRQAQCHSAGAKYHFEIQPFQMFGTVADCFIAVDQLVMRERKLTLKELLQAVDADFVGYEETLALCRSADKYGMDTPLSNAHAARLSKTACDLVIEKSRHYLEKQRLFLLPCMQSDTWHLKCGEQFGATPDGRRAHSPFSQNIRPSNGVCVNGVTAMLNSVCQLPQDGLLSGALNLDIDKKLLEGEDGKTILESLLGVYFNQGGLHAQVSCVSADDLIDAQKNPHLHRDLRVRVTGYSGVFVDICKRLQDDIINRLK